jgi:hypothetical protein
MVLRVGQVPKAMMFQFKTPQLGSKQRGFKFKFFVFFQQNQINHET